MQGKTSVELNDRCKKDENFFTISHPPSVLQRPTGSFKGSLQTSNAHI